MPNTVNLTQAWHLGDQLGSGGFGKVYLAQDDRGECAVVKLLPKVPGSQRELLFEELEGARNVVPVLDRGESGDCWVLLMPRAEKSLRDHLASMGGRLTINKAVSVLVDIAEALVAVEDRDVVHRDIKPENILLLNGHWHLADFGIARYAEATTAPDTLKHAMTRAYAAPEQWRGDRATFATDVYALGVVAYELLAGKWPFGGPDYRRQHLQDAPEAIVGIPDRLRSLVSECLYKGPEARPRPQNLLARLKSSLESVSPAGSRLQHANAIVVEQQAEASRLESVAQARAERRTELYKAANQSLENILALLDRQIKDNASSVRTEPGASLKRWELNGVELLVGSLKAVALRGDEALPFEVIAHTEIRVAQPQNSMGYSGRSHSLWYCDAQEQGMFRWYETAFWELRGGSSLKPFAMPPDAQNTALALSGTIHTYSAARPFTPIDQGNEEEFIERWMGWFAQAAQGSLAYPSRMPEVDPQGSWRRP